MCFSATNHAVLIPKHGLKQSAQGLTAVCQNQQPIINKDLFYIKTLGCWS